MQSLGLDNSPDSKPRLGTGEGEVPLANNAAEGLFSQMTDRALLVHVAAEVSAHGVRLTALERRLRTSALLLAVVISIASSVAPDLGALLPLVQAIWN